MRLARWLLPLSVHRCRSCQVAIASPTARTPPAPRRPTRFSPRSRSARREYLDPTASYAIDETPLHVLDLRAAVSLPLSEAAVRDRAAHRRGGRGAAVSSTRTATSCRPMRRARTSPKRSTTSRSRRASVMRRIRPSRGCERQVPISRADRRRVRRQAHAVRLRRPGHARADRARLRLRDPPAGDDAHQVGVVFADGRAHRRPEGVRRADRCGRQGAAQGHRSLTEPRSAVSRLPPV